jgi:aconitate hydratase
MSPEYGATCGYFAVDELTLDYLRLTGRSEEHVALVEAYCRGNLLWHEPGEQPEYSQVVELDLGEVEPSLAGPRRPQDRVPLARAKESFLEALDSFGVAYGNGDEAVEETFPASDATSEQAPGGHPVTLPEGSVAVAAPRRIEVSVTIDGGVLALTHGAVVIAAITSCTNTSTAGDGAAVCSRTGRRARARAPWVKTSWRPARAS